MWVAGRRGGYDVIMNGCVQSRRYVPDTWALLFSMKPSYCLAFDLSMTSISLLHA